MRLNATKLFTSGGLVLGVALAVASVAQASTDNLFTPPASLKAWWRFDEASANLGASNSGPGGGYTLLGHGAAAFAPGCTNNGLVLPNSAGDYVDVADPTGTAPFDFGTGSFTLRATVQTTNTITTLRTILDHRASSSGPGYSLYVSFGHVGVQIGDAGGFTNFTADSPILTDGLCHCVVATMDRSLGVGRLWVDGVNVVAFDPIQNTHLLTFNISSRSGTVSNTGNIRVGQAVDNSSAAFIGKIDEVQLYNAALSPAQVDSICGTCTPHPSNLLDWWPLDETSSLPGARDNVAAYYPGSYQNSATHVVGKVAGAVHLGSLGSGLGLTADYVKIPVSNDAIPPGGSFSIDAWVQVLDVNTSTRTILDHRGYGAWGQRPKGYALYINHGHLGVQIADGSSVVGNSGFPGYDNYTSDQALPSLTNGGWNFVAVTINLGTQLGRLYINGSPVTYNGSTAPFSLVNSRTQINFTGPTLIGQSFDQQFPSIAFDGNIDEVEVYSRDLLPSEITNLFSFGEAGKCVTPPVPGVDRNGMLVMSLLLLLGGGYGLLRKRGQGNLSA